MASDRIMRVAVDAARADIALMLLPITELGEVPERIWEDPYVIGYLCSVGGLAAEDATDGRLKEKHLAKAAFRALASLAAKQEAVLRAVVEDGTEEALVEFEDGFNAACKVAAVAMGENNFDLDEDVIRARKFVAENKGLLDRDGAPPDEASRVLALLQCALFHAYVVETYLPAAAAEIAIADGERR